MSKIRLPKKLSQSLWKPYFNTRLLKFHKLLIFRPIISNELLSFKTVCYKNNALIQKRNIFIQSVKWKYRIFFCQFVSHKVSQIHWLNFIQKECSLKSLAKEFGASKDSIAIWVKQTTPVKVKGHSETLKNVQQLEKRFAILEKENEILSHM